MSYTEIMQITASAYLWLICFIDSKYTKYAQDNYKGEDCQVSHVVPHMQ